MMSQINRLHLCHLHWFVLLFISELCSPSHSLPTLSVDRSKGPRFIDSVQSEYEQCFFQSDNGAKLLKTHYGQCMSTNGPDGCCLEGHYKPGICPNLGHICCTKPDPDCSKMRNNKDIARQMLKQRREHFKTFAKENSKEEIRQSDQTPQVGLPGTHYRPARSSSNKQIRVNFEIVEMPAQMQLDAVSFVADALDRHKGDTDKAAYYLCRMLDQKYPEPTNWACVVGTNFNYSIEVFPGKYMLFYIGNTNHIQVMAFVPKAPEQNQ